MKGNNGKKFDDYLILNDDFSTIFELRKNL